MKLSIWQQFSSNHSARFTVVGKFESVVQAREAADVLLGLLKRIFDWFESRGGIPPEDFEVSPVEHEIAQQYGVEWNAVSLIDWIYFGEYGPPPVEVMDNLVFVRGTESGIAAKPVDALVERLGGKAMVDGAREILGDDYSDAVHSRVRAHVTATAPDDQSASQVYDAVHNHLLGLQRHDYDTMFHTPWEGCQHSHAQSDVRGTIERRGSILTIDAVFFHIADGLPAMLAYLRDNGFLDVHYELIEEMEEFEE